jgi:hypothetical protein
VSVRSWFCVLALFAASARAHDLYEITSVAYVHSNVIELFIEMEFPAGMRLAGVEPKRDETVLSQFEKAQPQLAALAGNFFDFTAGNNKVTTLTTNVTLSEEDHIQLKLEYAATSQWPLQFTARGLQGENNSPYGTTLTVLDMANQKVLGQTTLFADSPPAIFPPAPIETSAPAARLDAGSNQVAASPAVSPPPRRSLLFPLTLLGAGCLITFAFFRRRN